jgi:hypothetical protein
MMLEGAEKMAKGPRGEKRPADAVSCAVMVARIATGEVLEELKPRTGRIKSGEAGAAARASSLTKDERIRIAKKAAEARWR